MQYLLIKSKIPFDEKNIKKIKQDFEETTTILARHVNYEWISNDKKTLFIGRNPKLEIYDKYTVFNVDENNNLSFIHGWLKNENEDKLMNAINLDKTPYLDGFFNAGQINNNGIGEIFSSKFHPSIYKAESEQMFGISNRISCLSKIFGYNEINKKYIATHIQYQSSAINFETMFQNIYQIPFSSKIFFKNQLETEINYDYLFDDKLQDLYLNDKNRYWDECFKKMMSQVKAFVNLGVEDKFILGISGGKDSRLLLAIYNEHINSTFTAGPPFSPEVIVGKMVSDALKLKQNVNFSNNPSSTSVNLMEMMPQHLFVREFEMCPWDFGYLQKNTKETITIDGQEFVRTKPLNIKNIDKIYDNIASDFENNFAINNDYNEIISKDTLKHVKERLESMNDPSKFSLIKRQLERGRWVSKVHETIFDHSFNIYPLISNTALTYAFNIKNESMFLEEFHFELMKRANPKLINIPFFNDFFKLNPVPPVENKIPGKLNYKNDYLIKYYEYIMIYIENHFDLINDIVKKDFIENLTKDKLFNNPKLSQVIYNILQYILLISTSNYEDLKNMLELDWKIDDIQVKNDYSENLVKSYVEYNKDIVDLKIKINELNNEINKSNELKSQQIKLPDDNNEKSFVYNKFKKYNTARIDLKNIGDSKNNLEITNISDPNAKVMMPNWLKNDKGVGIIIESQKNNIDIELKCIENGILMIKLRGQDVRNKEGERIPIYINYTKMLVNEKIIFKEKLIWHDTPYHYQINVKNNEIVKLHFEWVPF